MGGALDVDFWRDGRSSKRGKEDEGKGAGIDTEVEGGVWRVVRFDLLSL